MSKTRRRVLRYSKVLPVFFLYQSFGCLPDDAFVQVFGENIVLTSAIAIQSITSIVFNALFSFV